MKSILAVLVEDKPGVMARVSGLFRRRGFNIASVSVGPTQEAGVSRMTLVVDGDQRHVEQVKKQLYKLIDVIKIVDLAPGSTVERELVLVKVRAEEKSRPEVLQLVDVFRARIVDVAARSITIELTGDDSKVEAFLQLMSKFGIEETARTGKTAIGRGTKLDRTEGLRSESLAPRSSSKVSPPNGSEPKRAASDPLPKRGARPG